MLKYATKTSLRPLKIATVTAAAAALSVIISGWNSASAQNISPLATPDQLAAAIARTMTATKPGTPANSPIRQDFVSNKNVVESRTTFNSADGLANAASQRTKLQIVSTRYMCKAERLAYIERGVVFRDIFTGPNSTGGFSFVIDKKACASLENPVLADQATLTKLADDIAKAIPNDQAFAGSRFAGLTRHEGTISLTYDIVAPAFINFFKYKSSEIRSRTQGMYCQKFGDAIRRGVQIQVIYKLDSSPPILQFSVENSIC